MFLRVFSRTARRDTTMLPGARSIFRIGTGRGCIPSAGDIAHGADIDLRTGQERDGAVQVDGEANLHAWLRSRLSDAVVREFGFQLNPTAVATRARSRAAIVSPIASLDARSDIDLTLVVDLEVSLLPRRQQFAAHLASDQTDVDDGHVVLDASGHGAMQSRPEAVGAAERFAQHRREIVAGRHTWVAIEFSNPSLFPGRRLGPLVRLRRADDLKRRRSIRRHEARRRVDLNGGKRRVEDLRLRASTASPPDGSV